MHCDAAHGQSTIDLAEQMAADGYAVSIGNSDRDYVGEGRIAFEERRGLLALGFAPGCLADE